jgi:hypothetical protein
MVVYEGHLKYSIGIYTSENRGILFDEAFYWHAWGCIGLIYSD